MGTDALNAARSSKHAALLLAGILAATVAIYLPGLHGPLVFDDASFLINNSAVQVTTLSLGDWISAAFSFPSGSHQGRWLGMLSFAVNHYFTGLDPYWLKLTNVGIHLANGVLLFFLLSALFALWRECRIDRARPNFDASLAAAAIAGLWLVLPINTSAVLYASQRLESLSNTFVFLGLWLYLRARIAHWRGEHGAAGLWTSLVVCTGIGVLVKESAVMLPLYAACIELTVAGARTRDGRVSRNVLVLYAVLIGVPLLSGALWLSSWIGSASSYARPFDTVQRLMTEARVLIDYMQWTLLPQAESLTLYHDDIVISHGLLAPPATLGAIAALLALLGLALWQRTRRPLFTLGVLWFFSGHLLTGTVIPLMLAFEHRNYFPSVGLLLAASSIVALEGGLQRSRVRIALCTCIFGFYAFTTWMRAEEWSDPLRLALSEADKRPDSSAAQYELGRVLLSSKTRDEGTSMSSKAFEVLERASHLPNSDILSEELLIVGHAQLKQAVDPAWWSSLIAKLRARPPTTADIAGLIQLFHCQQQTVCPGDTENLQAAFEAATSHPSTNGVLLSIHAEFSDEYLHDGALAEQQYRKALALAPNEPMTHVNLALFLARQGRTSEARAELEALKGLSHFGSLEKTIIELDRLLREAESSSGLPTPEGSKTPSTAESDQKRRPVP